jgi:hypothetical protein
MSLGVTRSFQSFDSLLRFYSDADEIVFQLSSKLDDQELACVCRESRQTADHLRKHFGACGTSELARVFGVEILQERRQAGEEQASGLGECVLRPPTIKLKLDSIERVAKVGRSVAGADRQPWFTEEHITEVVVAYELHQIVRQRFPSPSIETAAHCFARAFTGTPFSGLLYQSLLSFNLEISGEIPGDPSGNFGPNDVLFSRH